jgi:hypothetical protein
MLYGDRDRGWQAWIEELADRITEQTARDNDPLDGDETELIGRLLWLELDLRQGNLSENEYEERKALLESGKIW